MAEEQKKSISKQGKKTTTQKKDAQKQVVSKSDVKVEVSNKLKVGTLVITDRNKECKVLEVISNNLFLLKRTDDTGKLYNLTKDQFTIKK